MKTIIALLLVALVYVQAELTPDQVVKVQRYITECKAEFQVTDEDISLLMQLKVPNTQNGKCFDACIKKKLGILDADNKVDMTRVRELMDHAKDTAADKYDVMMTVIETCVAEVPPSSDECDVSTKLMECAIREFDAKGEKIHFLSYFSNIA